MGDGDSNLPDISPPTRLPPKRQDRSDDESFMEVTIADQVSNPSVLMSPPDLTSPHLTSMLSSRMFADMQLPPELQQQQAQQRSVDGDREFYPTITIHPDDDEMTQMLLGGARCRWWQAQGWHRRLRTLQQGWRRRARCRSDTP